METSSVSPERAETMARMPLSCAARQQASVSVTVPTWLGLSSTALASAGSSRAAEVTNRSSPTICTRAPAARVKARIASWSFSANGSSMETMG